jgi:hypothetical protein
MSIQFANRKQIGPTAGLLNTEIKNEANFICPFGFLGLPLILIP